MPFPHLYMYIYIKVYICAFFATNSQKNMVTNPRDTVKMIKVKRLIPLGKLPHFTFTLSCKINVKYVMYYWL